MQNCSGGGIPLRSFAISALNPIFVFFACFADEIFCHSALYILHSTFPFDTVNPSAILVSMSSRHALGVRSRHYADMLFRPLLSVRSVPSVVKMNPDKSGQKPTPPLQMCYAINNFHPDTFHLSGPWSSLRCSGSPVQLLRTADY